MASSPLKIFVDPISGEVEAEPGGTGGGGGGGTCANSPQLTCRAGRTGTNNDTTISSNANGTLTGSGASGFNLLLHSNPSLNGYVEFDGQLRIKAGTPFGVGSQVIGESAGGALQILGLSPSTATSVVGGGLRGIALDPDSIATPILVQDSTYASIIIPGQIHLASPGGNAFIFAIIAGGTITITDSTNKLKVGLFSDNNTIVVDGTTQTLEDQVSFESEPVLQSINGGILTVNDSKVVWDNFSLVTDGTPGGIVTVVDHTGALSAPTIGDFCVITNRRGLWYQDYSDSGSATPNRGVAVNQIAVDVEDLPLHAGNPSTLTLSLRSFGPLVEMRHVGAGIFGANAAATNASVGLEVQSVTRALLLSRMSTTERNALTAVNGMLIYNSTDNKFQGYENGAWTNLI